MPDPPAARGAVCLRCFSLLREDERCDLCHEMPVSWRSPEGAEQYRQTVVRLATPSSRVQWVELALRGSLLTSVAVALISETLTPLTGAVAGTALVAEYTSKRLRARALLRRGTWKAGGEKRGRLAGKTLVASPLTGARCLGYAVVMVEPAGRAIVLRDAAAGPMFVDLDGGGRVTLIAGRIRVAVQRSQLDTARASKANAAEPFRSLLGRAGLVFERCLQPDDEVGLTLLEKDPYRDGPGPIVPRLRLLD